MASRIQDICGWTLSQSICIWLTYQRPSVPCLKAQQHDLLQRGPIWPRFTPLKPGGIVPSRGETCETTFQGRWQARSLQY